MNRMFSVWRKELRSLFNSPVAYGAILFFLIFTAVWFLWMDQFLAQKVASLRNYFALFPLAFIVLVPAVTMRSWADERKMGSQELLLTLPVRTGHLVLAKFLAAWTLILTMILLTIPMTVMVTGLGQFEMGEILGEYIGSILLSGAATALGIFLSGLATNTISAFLMSLGSLLILTLSVTLGAALSLPDAVGNILRFFSLDARYANFQRGLIDTKDALYYVWFAVLFLYLNTKVLILRKWR
ncbi:MAG: ABC transporter permease [Spirochaetales bacterium]|nr:ABC transporter permease [Spirochaetales bacterium]